MSWTRISVRYGAQPMALFSDLTVRCWWLWIPEMMRSVTIGKIRQLCSDKGSSMASGLSPLWEDGTLSPCHLSTHVNLIHMSSTVDLGTEKLQGRCGSPGRARLTHFLPAALKWLSWGGGRGKIRRDEVREKCGGCDWLKNWTGILHFYLGVFYIHTLVRASWWTGGTSLSFDFGLSHGTCFGQWDIHRCNVREDWNVIAQLASSLCASAIAVRCVCPEQPLPFQSKPQKVTCGGEQVQLSHRPTNNKNEYLLLVTDILRLFVMQCYVSIADQYRGESWCVSGRCHVDGKFQFLS